MRVDPLDGWCRSCAGVVEIVDADDARMTVECQDCGDTYLVEPDAFDDDGMVYYVGFLSNQMDAGHGG
jgi:hypothetical protein